VAGATDWWFYPVIAAAAAALIVVSLGAAPFTESPAPQRPAARDGGALSYGPHELARGLAVDGTQVRFVVRDYGVSARAVRLAVRPHTPPPAPGDEGARLLLNPADTAGLAGRPVDVTLQVRRLNVTAAAAVAVSLQNGSGPTAWATAPLPPESGPVTVRVTAPEGAGPSALGLRMLTEQTDYNYGAEIVRVSLSPAAGR
jgi:hypothetical protein